MYSEITQLSASHQSLRKLAQQLRACQDHEVGSTYARLLCQAEQVFGTEQKLMEQHEFPATQCHLEQHARVLCAMHKAHCAVMRGDHALGRHVGANLLMGWFELHNATLDAALTVWTSYRINPAQHPFNEATFWTRSQTHETPPRSSPWRGPERRAQPRL